MRLHVARLLAWFAPLMAIAEFVAVAGAASAAGGTQGATAEKLPVPPAARPRLYLRAEHVAQLPARFADPVLRPVVERLENLARESAQRRVELQALRYLMAPDAAGGRAIVEETLVLMQRYEMPQRWGVRFTGRMMVTGAMIYDWLYPLLTPEEKQAFIAEFVRLAQTQECGYPPTKQGSIVGHASEAAIMRDMISAGIAIHDEFPEMYEVSAGRFFREHLPARNWAYPGHAHHQGDSYGPYRYHWDTFPLFIFDRMGAGNVYTPEQQFVPYHWLYTTRPDGQRLRAGDSFKDYYLPRGEPWDEYLGTLFTASYYKDGVLLSQFLKQGGGTYIDVGDDDVIFEFLWRDTALQPRPIASLPLSRYFGPPFGWMVARTGWGDDAVIAEMKINEYNFVNHQHLDAGAFQIYARGALAIDSGLYHGGSSGAYGSPHAVNYYWRTIAHNSLLIHDPDEQFPSSRAFGNDGGQRLPNRRSEPATLEQLLDPQRGYRTGRVLAHGHGPDAHTPDYTLLQGDITEAYSKKVRAVTRSFVFLNLRHEAVPAAMIILDRVVSADPAFRKYWLLHSLEQPQIAGTSATIDRTGDGGTGRLNVDVLLPAADNAQLSRIGGPGKEYWVFGTNYANDVAPEQLPKHSYETGAWRLELSPRKAAAEDLFLTVLQTTNWKSSGRFAVKQIGAGDRVGCVIAGPDASWVVWLRKSNERSGEPVRLVVEGNAARCRFLVTDLAPGRWQARRDGTGTAATFEVTAASGAGWFEGPAGTWVLTQTGSRMPR
jgi:hypothetical protein